MQTDTIAALRAQVARLERPSGSGAQLSSLPFGVTALDMRLPGGGLALSAVHEVFAGGPAAEHGAAPAVFAAGVLARHLGPVVWITAQRDLYPPALAAAGLHPGRLVLVHTRHGALQAMEDSLRHPGLAGVVCEHEGRLGLAASRRLQLAAETAGALGFILRRPRRSDGPALAAPSAAATRWRITALPSPPPLPHWPDEPGLGRPVWRLDLLRCRGGEAAGFVVEGPDAQGRLVVPSHLANRPLAPAWLRVAASGPALGHAHA